MNGREKLDSIINKSATKRTWLEDVIAVSRTYDYWGALDAAAELAALEAVVEAADEVNEWLKRTNRANTAHQKNLQNKLDALRKAQE